MIIFWADQVIHNAFLLAPWIKIWQTWISSVQMKKLKKALTMGEQGGREHLAALAKPKKDSAGGIAPHSHGKISSCSHKTTVHFLWGIKEKRRDADGCRWRKVVDLEKREKMNSSNDQLVRSFMNTLEIQQKAWESLWIYQTQEPVMFALKGTLYKVGLYISVDRSVVWRKTLCGVAIQGRKYWSYSDLGDHQVFSFTHR